MKQENGTLKKAKKGFLVTLPSKKGNADRPIPDAARCFRADDAADGTEVVVELDEQNRIVKVTVLGKPEVSPTGATPSATGRQQPAGPGRGAGGPRGGRPPYQSRGSQDSTQPRALTKLPKASCKVIGLPFHNPYTFLPFSTQAPRRRRPTPLTVDESPAERNRLSGILELEVTTQSPLLTCHPNPIDDKDGHKTYQILRIGPDAIVPATGIRGALRTLLTVLTGGTLGYLNEHAYLCQGRDANLGPRGANSPPGTPAHCFLAEVVRPGTALRSGEVRLGRTMLVRVEDLERCYGKKLPRNARSQLWVGLDERDRPVVVTEKRRPDAPWKLRLSGRPVNPRGKREAIFLASPDTLTLPPGLWAAYSGRNAHGDRPEPRKGDLIWLEPVDPEAKRIQRAEDVKSLQWARWGKTGQALKDKVPAQVLPDCLQTDGLVDEVTDLFGQVPMNSGSPAQAFAARVRPENLVFFDAASTAKRVRLAPLAPPHPGCIAFYRNNSDPNLISENDQLRGYKVYRTTREQGSQTPWLYDVQGVYDEGGRLKPGLQKVSKTCDLLPAGATGQLRLAFRALTKRELALLLQACLVPWRLGGGKPLGLGLCTVRVTNLINEDGDPLQVPGWKIENGDGDSFQIEGWEAEVQDIAARVQMWTASQVPVDRLRYPRAVSENNFGKSRGGHVWFQRHAAPRMVTGKGGGREPGLGPLHIGGALQAAAERAGEPLDQVTPLLAGQILPLFDPQNPEADLLYGYDGYDIDCQTLDRPRRRVYLQIEAFDDTQHVTGREQSEGSHGKDAQFRRAQKEGRTRDE